MRIHGLGYVIEVNCQAFCTQVGERYNTGCQSMSKYLMGSLYAKHTSDFVLAIVGIPVCEETSI